jgi:5'(3')-deoxyribonucleotidase
MIIAIDVDEVLADLLSQFIKYHNNLYGTDLRREEFLTYNWWEVIGDGYANDKEKILSFFKSPDVDLIRPIVGAQDGVKELKKENDLVIVTSRHFSLSVLTEHWVKKYFPDSFSKFYYTKSTVNQNTITKFDACRAAGAQLLIDDQFAFADEVADHDIKVLLFDQPWNRAYPPHKCITRVSSWPDTIARIRESRI